VLLGMRLSGFFSMTSSMKHMAHRRMSLVRRLLVISRLVMFSRFAVMFGRMRKVLGRFFVVVGCIFRHDSSKDVEVTR
jgi:hypothetical protein